MRVVPLSLPVAALSLLGSSWALPARSSDDAQARADAVKAAFQHAWDGYKKYAFPHDELLPVSDGYGDSRNGWGASAVDALSTAVVMRNADVVNQILDYIPTIDYSQTNSQVSLFETNIRYLAGMLAGYDLLKGPLAGLAKNESNVEALLAQAQNLANVLKYAFNTPSGIPYNNLYVTTQTTDGSTSNGLATTGSLVLEWTRLSDLLGDSEYADLTQRAESHLLHPQPPTAQPFPGLVGTNINIDTGLFEDGSVSWGGGDDSFYEYLIKMYVYDPTRFAEYKNRWVAAAESTMQHLASHPSSRPDLTFLATYNNGQYGNNSQHLTCFDGGSFLLGGSVLGRQDFVDFGLALVDGCYDTYKETATGIGPEQFSWDISAIPADQQAFYNRAGFYITSGAYILRPEVLESIYYAYRITGNQKYRDWSWDAFKAINDTCWTPSGYAGLNNVNAQDGGGFIDNQESFFFAEVLKYSFLIQVPDEEYQVQGDGHNFFVFNTEAHPFRVAHVARKA